MASDQPTSLSPQNLKLKAQLQAVGAVPFFEKCLTSSDTGAHGRVVLPKAVAEAQFAEYLEKQGAQMVGEDVDGQTYDFRFRFWLNNQSRMYLIEGCLEMIKKYKLQKGDVIVFARKADGTLVVGGRPAGPEDASKRPTVRQRPAKGDEKGKSAKRRREGPLTDGVFRTVQQPTNTRGVIQDGSCFACYISIAGEVFKALFSLEPDAYAAFRAACPQESAHATPSGAAPAPAGAQGMQGMQPAGGQANGMSGGRAGPGGSPGGAAPAPMSMPQGGPAIGGMQQAPGPGVMGGAGVMGAGVGGPQGGGGNPMGGMHGRS
eukprot:jgi/Ulvmu1/12372/UM009_0018.1